MDNVLTRFFEQLRGVRLRLLEHRRQDVACVHLGSLGALHVQDGRLQDAAEGRRLFRLALLAAPELLDHVVQVLVEVAAEPREIHAAALQNALAFGIVGQREEQVLERQVGVASRDSLAVGDGQNDFERGGKHGSSIIRSGGPRARRPPRDGSRARRDVVRFQASSVTAFRGKPASRAMEMTVSALVSATSQG